jgi:hypothetical protein
MPIAMNADAVVVSSDVLLQTIGYYERLWYSLWPIAIPWARKKEEDDD